jgi:hypothetical protein
VLSRYRESLHQSVTENIPTSEDILLDPVSGGVHVLARNLTGTVAYFHKPWAASWAGHEDSKWKVGRAFRARFLREPRGGAFVVVGGLNPESPALRLRRYAAADLQSPLRWHGNGATEIDLREIGITYPSAIYVPGPSYQSGALGRPTLAVCGPPWEKDNEIWQVEVD